MGVPGLPNPMELARKFRGMVDIRLFDFSEGA
jgi:hypothetical protein